MSLAFEPGILELEVWDFFGAWNLGFGAFARDGLR